MTLSISVIDKRLVKSAIVNAALSLFCGIFSIIYLQFSYGQSSPFMAFLFVPTLANAIFSCVLGLTRAGKKISRAAFNLWNSAVACLTFGFLFRAIVNISGRVTEFDIVYYILAAAFGVAAVISGVIFGVRHRGDCI